jgi:FkbM family methyltransferase
MTGLLRSLYRRLFVRRAFFRANQFVHELTLHGIGVLNYEDGRSGETVLLDRLAVLVAAPVIVDVGANTGDYAAAVLARAPRARVLAFEPHPATFARLNRRAAATGFTAYNLALGAEPGHLELYDYDGSEGTQHASLYREVISTIHHGGEPLATHVEVATLDDQLRREGVTHVDLLKIDTEGHELAVLQGAGELLAAGAIAAVVFEFNEMNVVSRVFLRDFYELLPGYCFYRLLPDGMVPLGSYVARRCEIFAYQNILAVREGGPLTQLLSA